MNKSIDEYIADAIMERPYGFTVGEEHFFLYPVTLGKMYLLKRQMEALEIKHDFMQSDFTLEAVRIAKEKRAECLTVIATHTCRTKDELFDIEEVQRRKDVLDRNLDEEDIATLMITVLTENRTEQFIEHLGIDKELADMRKVTKVKSDRNTYNFGGKSVYGAFIYPLLELGMTWDEIVWERSYTNLRMLIADKTVSIYVTDEERKKINLPNDRTRINGDDREAVMRVIKSQKWN